MTGTCAEWHEEYRLALKHTERIGEETKESYYKEVGRFIRWWGPEKDIETADKTAVLRYVTYNRDERNLTAATRRMRLFCLLDFYRYVCKEEDSGVTGNPIDGIEFPVPKQQPPEIIPDDDLVALLDTAAGSSFVARRDTAIIRMLVDTGTRRKELCGVDLVDVDRGHQQVKVLGKGGLFRLIPYGAKTALALQKYLRARGQRQIGSEPALFVATRPNPRGSFRLSGSGVYEMIKRRAERAGLPDTWPHKVRHTWAHDLLANGASEQDLERLGGWAPGSMMVKWYGSSAADERARDRHRALARGDRL
ncbi:tyrosine-type recombinase/integrase [Amycolatopsis sp. BJA-103]|uniref:tyrosine-type recombinase/integrase n=1 Tax=Amycolatopsis sp. BJA-103 TaxID=1911175 RepID=UPI000CA1CDC5|nr:tyrosine-type recombinase/integrase [Amycolatopsis sp. BJA-103]AUI56766.1 hypothetical protein BKN51_00095 [Amycolatopsis sp. BJA-103]AUI64124.1 hypothetical protein BKN51_42240 [Amycolatopsis sp. BJA-103]PNE13087.1 hypothetical protein B1H26_42400 [Amycolatopsis sp. BJA-103]